MVAALGFGCEGIDRRVAKGHRRARGRDRQSSHPIPVLVAAVPDRKRTMSRRQYAEKNMLACYTRKWFMQKSIGQRLGSRKKLV